MHQPPSYSVSHYLLHILASELTQGESRVNDDVGGKFLSLRELRLVGLTGVVGVLTIHKFLRQV